MRVSSGVTYKSSRLSRLRANVLPVTVLRFFGERHRFRSRRDPVEFFGSSGVTYYSASRACRPKERLRLQRPSPWGASPPPALVVPGNASASSARGSGERLRLQRWSSQGRLRLWSSQEASPRASSASRPGDRLRLQRQSSEGASPVPIARFTRRWAQIERLPRSLSITT